MISFSNIKQYSQIVKNGIRFYLSNNKNPYLISYFSENSNLLSDYSKLQISNIDVRAVVVPSAINPRLRINSNIIKEFKEFNLYAFSEINYPKNKSLFIDNTLYNELIDEKFNPDTYRQRAGNFIQSYFERNLNIFPNNYKKIVIYSIDLDKSLNSFTNRKFFLTLNNNLRYEKLFFDSLLLCLIKNGTPYYRLLIKDGIYDYQRIVGILRSISPSMKHEENKESELIISTKDNIISDDETPISLRNREISNSITNGLSAILRSKNISKIQTPILNYLSHDEKTAEKLSNTNIEDIKKEELAKVIINSVLFHINNDLNKTFNITKSIPNSKVISSLKKIEKEFVDELLIKKNPKIETNNILLKSLDISKLVNNVSPQHLFEKRKIDFETNLRKDVEKVFGTLANKEVILKLEDLKIESKEHKIGEIEKSDFSVIKVKLKDEFGKYHYLNIDIPKIDPKTGTFYMSGLKKCLINQMVQCPITFPKPYTARFESSYSQFHIYSKTSRQGEYLEIYMIYKIPLLVLLSFAYGFNNTLEKYGIKYKITDIKPKKNEIFTKLNDKDYIVFSNIDNELKKQLINAFLFIKPSNYDIKHEFPSKEYFNKLIIKLSSRINSTYLIQGILDNIVDPVSKQILINQSLPFELENILEYMASKVITGEITEKNNLKNQRIRNSEILVHLLQRRVLAAYTEYKEQVLSGNEDAEFSMNSKQILADFNKVEVVTNMEYANPIEELGTLMRTTLVGKDISGIGSKRAVQNETRNVNPSYFGNIDPLDTPEGSNIGIVQHLSMGAILSSSRGIFGIKNIDTKSGPDILSPASALTPFIETTEGTRMIMATNQCKQAVPLKNPEPPIVRTGYETIMVNMVSDSFIKRSPIDGKVHKIEENKIILLDRDNKKISIDTSPAHLKSGIGKNTLSVFRPTVKENENVEHNEIIAEGACISDGSIALGKTVCVAFMPYKGYNFEDGIVISDSLVKSEKLTSLHGHVEKIEVSEKDRIVFISPIGINTKKGDIILRKTIGEIEELIGFDELDEEENKEVSSGELVVRSDGGRIVEIEVFSNVPDDKFPILKEYINKTREKYGVTSNEKFKIKDEIFKGLIIKFKIEQEFGIGIGDKMSGRVGNKGIISLVEKEKNMPITPTGDKIEVILNPIGVINRMNMSQLYETYCGLISKKLANLSSQLNDRKKIIDLFKKIYGILDRSPNKINTVRMIDSLSRLSVSEFEKMMDQIKNKGFVPIVVAPFNSPKSNQIMEALTELDLKDSYKLYLPEYKIETYYSVPYGYMYMYKLEHIGELKIHARSTGPIKGKTAQPTQGKSHMGGQRFGEADVYALMGYNCPKALHELMGPLSDDQVSKNEMISEIIHTGETNLKPLKSSPTRDLLNAYFISLMLTKG